jgi:hypothetical protein
MLARTAHSTYCAVPPRKPPSSTISAVERLNGAKPRIACTTLIREERTNIPR